MSWINYDEVITTLKLDGFDIDSLVIGRMTRVKRPGHDQKGWYIVHEITLDGTNDQALIGSYGYFSGADSITHKISAGKGRKLSEEQKKAIDARHKAEKERAERERMQRADRAAHEAARVWRAYVETGASDYLTRKGVGAFGVRYSPSGNGTMAIPMMDAASRVWGLQIIRGKDRGNKLEKEYFPAGLEKKGKFHLIGLPRDVLLVAEGYATAATLHQATGLPVAVAFDAGNLLPVCQALQKQYKKVRILVCADDDYLTAEKSGTNPGCQKAEMAALAVGGAWVKPEFPADRGGKKLTDFNDLAHFPDGGEVLVRAQIEKAIAATGWPVRVTVYSARESANGGEGEKARPAAVSVMSVDDAVERFVPIDDGTGKHVFDMWTRRIALREQMVALLPAGARGDDIKRHPTWINRGAYYLDEVGFDPSEKDATVKLNTWTGFEMQPVPGKCEKLLETLYHLCKKEPNAQELVMWILRWMAYPLQNPGAKMGSALIFHGPQGTGKSLIFRVLAAIYGRYATVIGNSGIEDKFNADWSDSKCFILAEEIATNADKWNIKNELKELVTGETIRVRDMHIRAYHQKNHMNVVYLSNEDMPLPLENSDRRHLVIYTPPCLQEDHYVEVLKERDNGGIEAFYHFLMNIPLDGFSRHSRPPMTEAKAELIRLSLPSEQRFVQDWIEGHTDHPLCPCLSMDLYSAYIRWCKTNGESRPRASHQFLGMVGHMTGWRSGPQRVFDGRACVGQTKPKRMVIPDESLLQKAGTANPGGKTQAEWLTECLMDFKESTESATAWKDAA